MSDYVPEQDIEIMQGADKTFTLNLTDNNDNAVDLTSYTAKLEIRDRPGGASISSLTSSPAAGITITAATGTIVIAWTAAQTALFTFTTAPYDLFLTSGTGAKTCILRGNIQLIQRVSQ